MFKDMKLGVKLGLGFEILVLLTCALGLLAVGKVRSVQAGGEDMAQRVEGIAAAAEEQSASTGEINRASVEARKVDRPQ